MTQPDPNAPVTAQEPSQPPETTPWGDDENFDPEKAKRLITNLRSENTKLKNRPVLTDEHQQQLTEFEKIKAANQTELEKATEATSRWQSEAETWRNAAVGSTVRALAATDFADPDDAVNALDPQSYLDAGGQINEQAIKADLAKLLDAKPHYRRIDGPTGPRVPAPNPSQGSGVNGRSAPDPANEFAAILQGQLK